MEKIKMFLSRGKKKPLEKDKRQGTVIYTRKQPDPELEEHGLLDSPWRLLEQNGNWTEQYAEKLISDITKHEIKETDVRNIRILLLGQIRAGKSSFLNTVASIDKGRISQITVAGGADSSVSVLILDTMGMEDHDQGGLNLKDVLYVVKGHVPPDYKFNPASNIDEESGEFRTDPTVNDRIHCVVFVMDANIVGQKNISDAARQNIKALQSALRSLDVPRILLLTKIDVLCEMVDSRSCTSSAGAVSCSETKHFSCQEL